jgi:predicted O-methyltransferase YrrM
MNTTLERGTFPRELILSVAETCNHPTGDPVLDFMFARYNEASPHEDCPVYYRFLYRLMQAVSPHNNGVKMIELGCKYGAATLHFIKGGGALSLMIDCHEQIDPRFLTQQAGDRWRFRQCRSTSAAAVEAANEYGDGGKFDIVFIDTDHAYETTRAEFAFWRSRVKEGGLILFDDIGTGGYACSKFWNQLHGDKLSLPELHPVGWGFGVYFA